MKTEHAEYNKDDKLFEKRETKLETSEKFSLQLEKILYLIIKIILYKSNKPTIIKDLENNNIYLEI